LGIVILKELEDILIHITNYQVQENSQNCAPHLLKNPDTPQVLSNSYQLLKFDSETNEKILHKNFNSLADILRYFDVYRNGHNWKQKYLEGGKPYKKIWFIVPLEPCEVEEKQTDDSKEF
jgi:hypothetical protein